MSMNDEPIWDGNGGELDPAKMTQRDMQVLMHYKIDKTIIPALKDLQTWKSQQEQGIYTEAQKRSVLEIVADGKEAGAARLNLKMPAIAVLISLATLVAMILLTFTGGPHGG